MTLQCGKDFLRNSKTQRQRFKRPGNPNGKMDNNRRDFYGHFLKATQTAPVGFHICALNTLRNGF